MASVRSSSWFDVDVVPGAYMLPEEFRPGTINSSNKIDKQVTFSVIDLSKIDCSSEDKEKTIQQILKACQEVGVIQVINHGFSEELIDEATKIIKEFFNLGAEQKVNSGNKSGWVYLSSTDYANHGAYLWRESYKITCPTSHQSLEDCMQCWPARPSRFREVVATYLLAMRKLSSRLLELICEGLGLETEYLQDAGEVQLMVGNYYPPCPDPKLTMGLPPHKDPSFITLLYQENISGLQVLQGGEWITVEPIPNAFVVNIGDQLEIISNGRLKSPEHRAVVNAEKSRLTIGTFTNPGPNYIVKPALALINESNPPLFEPTTYAEHISRSQVIPREAQSFLTK